ncbi:MAG: hypothetical protein LBB18_03175 [Puniceicoccales bacterium]|jgi:UDP-N-acetylmuramoyl-tripeptide--D-alanyl-D-alanine ligase|nr:hypothetical protein [Puniceicoccales bacterium]
MNIPAFFDGKIGYWLNGRVPEKVARLCNDTRSLVPGDAFVALLTDTADGHDFLRHAEEKGASCALVSKPNGMLRLPQFICGDTKIALTEIAKLARSMFKGKVIAVTGSIGKTTTKEILRLLLDVKHNATFENKNGQLGIPMTLAVLNNGENFAIVEVGVDVTGNMDRFAELIRPDVAVVTKIERIHIAGMRDESTIAREKCKLPVWAIENNGYGVFNGACLKFEDFRRISNSCIVVEERGTNVGYEVMSNGDGHSVFVAMDGERMEFTVPRLMSTGVAENFALACVCARKFGVDSKKIQEKIAGWTPAKWRGEIVRTRERVYFADCYNANLAALMDSLVQFDKLFPHGGRLFVIGTLMEKELGETAENANRTVCEILPIRASDAVVIVGENADRFLGKISCSSKKFFQSVREAREIVEKFSGVVYLKGHRHYKLENLIL